MPYYCHKSVTWHRAYFLSCGLFLLKLSKKSVAWKFEEQWTKLCNRNCRLSSDRFVSWLRLYSRRKMGRITCCFLLTSARVVLVGAYESAWGGLGGWRLAIPGVYRRLSKQLIPFYCENVRALWLLSLRPPPGTWPCPRRPLLPVRPALIRALEARKRKARSLCVCVGCRLLNASRRGIFNYGCMLTPARAHRLHHLLALDAYAHVSSFNNNNDLAHSFADSASARKIRRRARSVNVAPRCAAEGNYGKITATGAARRKIHRPTHC